MEKPRISISLAWVLAGLGCLAISAQVIVVREFLAVFSGNELCLGIIFSCWFVGIVLGAELGGRVSQRIINDRAALLCCCTVLVVSLPALVTLLRSWRGILGITVGELPGLGELLISSLLLLAPFGMFIGGSFPLVCRLASPSENPLTIGRVYVIESAGAIIGGVTIGVLLVGKLSPYDSMLLVMIPLLIGLILYSFENRLRIWGSFFCMLILGAICLLVTGGATVLDHITAGARFDDLSVGAKRIAWADSPYQHMDLSEEDGQVSLYADGKLTATFPDPYHARPRAHLVITEHQDPKKVLLLSSGSFEFVPAALSHPIENLDIVELDPEILRLVESHLDPATRLSIKDHRVQIHSTDGRRFLQQSQQKWDVIFSDAPDPTTAALNRFYTLEFFQQVRAHLAPQGIFAARLSSSATVLGTQTALWIQSIRITLQKVFGEVVVLPGEETFFFGCNSPGVLVDNPDALGQRYQQLGIQDPDFSRYHFRIMFQEGSVPELVSQLAQTSLVPLNTDSRPVTYLLGVLRWSQMNDDWLASLLGNLTKLPTWVWIGFLFLLGAIAWGYVFYKKPNRHQMSFRGAALAAFLVGALGLSLELVLTFSYQALYGSLYQEIGLIVAAFMAGLVIGGMWIQKRSRRSVTEVRLLGFALLSLAGFTAAMPWLQSSALLISLPMWAGQLVLFLLVILSGIGTGIVFPLSSQLAVLSGKPLGKVAGTLNALDHLGSALGAFLTGILLVPVFGRTVSCLALASLCAWIGFLNLWIRRKEPADLRP